MHHLNRKPATKLAFIFLLFALTWQHQKAMAQSNGNAGITPLQPSVASGYPEIKDSVQATEFFIQELATPSPVDINKLRYLLGKGADIKSTDKRGWSLLFEAAFQGDTALISLCLKNNLPVNNLNKTPYTITTPLYWAVERGHNKAAGLLRKAGGTFGIEDGIATQIYDSGNKYIGNFINGAKSGKGIFYYGNGDKYDGNWNDNLFNGFGTFTFADGIRFSGQYSEGRQIGKGTMWSHGDKFEGTFKDYLLDGHCSIQWKSGAHYDGYFANNNRNGRGIELLANGAKYDGEWKDDKKNGKGTFIWKSGLKYVGDWKDDAMEGYGRLYDKHNKLTYEGKFTDNKPADKKGWKQPE